MSIATLLHSACAIDAAVLLSVFIRASHYIAGNGDRPARMASMKVWVWLAVSFACFAGSMPKCEEGRLRWEQKGSNELTCGDFWMAPDQSAVVMTAVDRSNLKETFFLLWQSKQPMTLVELRVPELDREALPHGRLFRYPQLSPDGKLLYFEIPVSMTGVSQLLSITVNEKRRVEAVTHEAEYCVVWGGKYSGRLLVTQRESGDSLERPIVYRRRLLGLASGPRDLGAPPDAPPFLYDWLTRTRWLAANRGQCSLSARNESIELEEALRKATARHKDDVDRLAVED